MTTGIQYIGAGTELIWQPDIQATPFESGLVLVQRTAIARKSLPYSKHPKRGDKLPLTQPPRVRTGGLVSGGFAETTTGAIDGVYVYPDPRVVQNDPAFVAYQVTGYGRVNTTGTTRTEQFIYNRIYLAPRITKQFVVKSTDEVNPFDYINRLGKFSITSRFGDPIEIPASFLSVSVFERVPYGFFDEVTISIEPIVA